MLYHIFSNLQNDFEYKHYLAYKKNKDDEKEFFIDTIKIYSSNGKIKHIYKLDWEKRGFNKRVYKNIFFNNNILFKDIPLKIDRKIKLKLDKSNFIYKDDKEYNFLNLYTLYIYDGNIKKLGFSNDGEFLYYVYDVQGNKMFIQSRKLNRKIEEIEKRELKLIPYPCNFRKIEIYDIKKINITKLEEVFNQLKVLEDEKEKEKEKIRNRKLFNQIPFPIK